MKKRILPILFGLCLFMGTLPLSAAPVSAADKKYGITVDSNGIFKMNGKPVYAYGVNASSMIYDLMSDPTSESYIEQFAMLKKYNIPFIRLPLTGGTIEQYRSYDENQDAYFYAGDLIMKEAERQKIGVIVWLVNEARYVNLFEEKPAAIGDVNSKTMKFMRKVIGDTVKRYMNSPALWGWEIWNEGNLISDLYSTEYSGLFASLFGPARYPITGYDSLTSEDVQVMHREVGKVIRQHDPYRMISSGSAIMRECAHSLQKAAQKKTADRVWSVDWTPDTVESFRYMNNYFAPDPVNTLSLHMELPAENYAYRLKDQTLDYDALLKEYVSMAKKAKKGFYFGEFGCMGMDASKLDPALVKQQVPKNLQAMVKNGVVLASLWQFNGNNNIFNDEGNLGYMFQEISKINNQFAAQGMQDFSGMWPAPTSSGAGAPSKTSSAGKQSSSTAAGVSQTPESGAQPEIETYMRSSSTKLSISGEDNMITIEKPITLELFEKSIALREGYKLQVLDETGAEITDKSALVGGGSTVAVYTADGRELRRFTVAVSAGDAGSAESTRPAAVSSVRKDPAGGPGWILWTALILLVLAGAGAAVYYFGVYKKKNVPREDTQA